MGLHFHHTESGETSPNETQGSVWNWAWRYDRLIGLVTLGREQAFRQRIADLAQLQSGECVLDVGCGTGTLVRQGILHLRAEPRKSKVTGPITAILATLVLIAAIVFLVR